MAWGQLTKEDLQKVGLDVDALTTMKSKLDSIDLGKAKDEIKNEIKAELDDVKKGLDGLTQALSKLQPPIKKESDGTNGSQDSNSDEPDFLLDPAGATKKVVVDTVNPLLQNVAGMRADLNYANFKATNPAGFNKYESEIKEMFDKEPLGNRANPKLIENIYLLVLGKHAQDIAKEPKTFFIEPSAGGNAKDGRPDVKPEDQLSADELAIATKWGLKPEEYLEEKKRVTYA